MKRSAIAGLFVLALLVPSAAYADPAPKTYNFCGGTYGSGYTNMAFCASVTVAVSSTFDGTGYKVTMTIVNTSDQPGSYAGSVFAQIGMDNVFPASINISTPSNFSIKQDGIAKTGWTVNNDKAAAGGFKVDFLDGTTNGINNGIASCNNTLTNVIKTCGAAHAVVISFDVTGPWDPNNTGDVYAKGQGALGSTECETGSHGAQSCIPRSVTATPEPATLALMSTGLIGLGAPMLSRRRRRRSAEAAVDA